MRYIVTAFVMLCVGGIEALLMCLQLRGPNNTFLGPDAYNQIFTTHGTTMMFLFAVLMMEGMGVYLIPLMCGTRNIAFPRLNAYGYWLFLAGVLFLYWGVFTGLPARLPIWDGLPTHRFPDPNILQGSGRMFGPR